MRQKKRHRAKAPAASPADVAAWWEAAREGMVKDTLPKMRASRLCVTAFDQENICDPKLLMELGAALLLDKPLLIIVTDGTKIPSRVYDLAEEVVHIHSTLDADAQDKIQAAVQRIIAKGLK